MCLTIVYIPVIELIKEFIHKIVRVPARVFRGLGKIRLIQHARHGFFGIFKLDRIVHSLRNKDQISSQVHRRAVDVVFIICRDLKPVDYVSDLKFHRIPYLI